jgi:hypothetical protein
MERHIAVDLAPPPPHPKYSYRDDKVYMVEFADNTDLLKSSGIYTTCCDNK